MAKSVHVAVAVVSRGDEVLIARRPDTKHQGGMLEFPGGKVEPGESVRDALVRELAEEIAILADAAQMRPLIQIHHDYRDKQVLLDVWKVPAFDGEPTGLEGQPVGWMKISDLTDADFPVANRPIIRALRLPHEWLITGLCSDPETLSEKLNKALPRQATFGLVLRQPGLSPRAYLELAQAALNLCQSHNIPLMLHGGPELQLQVPGAAGVHLSQHALQTHRGNWLPQGKWFGVSCHTPEELTRAAAAGADYAFLSPVLPTASHPDKPALGWNSFAQWTAAAALPVYGLGGMQVRDMEQSQLHGGQGIAGIGYWWDPAHT